tara:strand:+ start:3207 stop:3599 length:393 start_codon:yes stop_codon:yes gene_type:complete
MDVKGKLIKIYAKKQVSDKFALREFVLATEDKYPQQIIMQVTQERCELLDNFAEGDEIQAFINIRGRSWTNPQGEVKYFNSLEAWKITNESSQSFEPYKDSTSDKSGIDANFMEDAISTLQSQDNDGLPF